MFDKYFYSSDLLPAAPVEHCYRNFWLRDGWYIGMCSDEPTRKRLWRGMVRIIDNYKWKLEYHSKIAPVHLWEHIHVRYSPEGYEIYEGWMHNQWDSIGNVLEVVIDEGRTDLAGLLVDYLNTAKFYRRPAAGAWEDRNTSDAYSLASCIHALQRAKKALPQRYEQIDRLVRHSLRRLNLLLPYATGERQVCLSLLGIIWPFNLAGPYRDEILTLVKKHLKKEPFGFIRYRGDKYDGEYMSRRDGNEIPWLLGDLFMHKIEPDNPEWMYRIEKAKEHFGFMPEGFFPESMKPNRNSPLLWAEALYNSLHDPQKPAAS
jgi:hypothetical protein